MLITTKLTKGLNRYKKLTIKILALGLIMNISQLAKANDLDRGEKDFITHCAACHGLNGEGNGDYAPLLTKVPIDLTRIAHENGGVFEREKIKKIVDGREMPRAHGSAQMPIWGNWFSEQALMSNVLQNDRSEIEKMVDARLNNLMTYLESIQE